MTQDRSTRTTAPSRSGRCVDSNATWAALGRGRGRVTSSSVCVIARRRRATDGSSPGTVTQHLRRSPNELVLCDVDREVVVADEQRRDLAEPARDLLPGSHPAADHGELVVTLDVPLDHATAERSVGLADEGVGKDVHEVRGGVVRDEVVSPRESPSESEQEEDPVDRQLWRDSHRHVADASDADLAGSADEPPSAGHRRDRRDARGGERRRLADRQVELEAGPGLGDLDGGHVSARAVWSCSA